MELFNQFYSSNSENIFASNLVQSIDAFSELNAQTIRSLPELTSFELIQMIISSDPFLISISNIVSWLKSSIHGGDDERSAFLMSLAREDMSIELNGGHLKNPKFRRLYDIIYETIKTNSLQASDGILKSAGLHSLAGILNGGLPFIDFKHYNKIRQGRDAHNFISELNLPDYMNLDKLRGLTGPECVGNHNWLVWLRFLSRVSNSTSYQEEQKLFAYLSSDFDRLVEFESATYVESALNFFRVIKWIIKSAT